jgi:hypothetical protein
MLNSSEQRTRNESINLELIGKLVLFLNPWKIILSELQCSKAPSLYTALPCITIFVLNSKQERRKRKEVRFLSFYHQQHAEDSFFLGIRFFYKRALHLLTSLFTMEEDYIVAAFLHPNYKQLRGAIHSQMANCYAACRISLLPNASSLSAPSEEE